MSNCFILGCEQTREAVIIDAGEFTAEIDDYRRSNSLTIKYIILTHSHVDHAADVGQFKKETGGEIVIHEAEEPLYLNLKAQARMFGFEIDAPPAPDRLVRHGDELIFGAEERLGIIHCPGHSPGGISVLWDSNVFVGDTLFAGSIGRTDLPGGDYRTLINSIKDRLLPLGDSIQALTGHGPATTLGAERLYNPFLA
ncbi:MAG: MBL fold metallo-hydrolase [Candidatus Lindowbacteria bacterium]|nr:MBL fold metallo-hydrolase [Candidatus Lindowbacteria bacterium]